MPVVQVDAVDRAEKAKLVAFGTAAQKQAYFVASFSKGPSEGS